MAEASKAEAGTQKAQAEGNGSQTKDKTVAELLDEFKSDKEPPKHEAASDPDKPKKAKPASDDDDAEEARYQRYRSRFDSEQAAKSDLKGLASEIAKETEMELDDVQDWLTSRMTRDGEVMQVWFRRKSDPAKWKALAKALTTEYVEKIEKAVAKKSSSKSDREAARASARTRTGAPAKSDTKAPFNWRQPGAYDRWKREQGHDR